jgi:TP901 family phage tail tape measure protein
MSQVATVGVLRLIGSVDTRKVQEGLSRMNGMVQGFTKKLSGIGAGAAGALGLAGGLGAAAVAASTLQTSMSVEDATVALGKAADLTGDQLRGMRDELLGLASQMGSVSTTELIDIATAGAKIGVGSDRLADYAKNVADLATAIDDMEPGELSNSMGVLTNMFKLDRVDGVVKLGSAIDALGDSAATNGSAIINVMSRMGGAANSLGLSADQAASLATALLDTGTNAEKAGGVLSRVLIDLASSTKGVDFANLLGVSEADYAKMLRDDPMKAVDGFLNALAGKDLTQVGSLLGSVGITSGEEIAELAKLANQTDKLAEFQRKANDEFATGARVQTSVEASSQKLTSSMKQLSNIMTEIKTNIGDQLLPIIKEFANYLNENLPHIVGSFEGLGDKVGFLMDFLAYLKPVGLGTWAVLTTGASLFWQTINGITQTVQSLINLVPGLSTSFADDLNLEGIAEQARMAAEKAQKAAESSFKIYTDPSLLPSQQLNQAASQSFEASTQLRSGKSDNSTQKVAENTAEAIPILKDIRSNLSNNQLTTMAF